MNSLNIKGRLIDLSVPKVMGIVNITPDSFFAGSRKNKIEEILAQVEKMIGEGVDIIDIGGYSSRPGADDIDENEEIIRIKQPIREIRERFPELIISIDSFRSKVADIALQNGADLVNDISGGTLDNQMYDLIIERRIPYIMMHMKGTPQTMKTLNQYDNLMKEVMCFFSEKADHLKLNGVSDIVIDPGFGFAKNREQNFVMLKHLDYFKHLELPMLVGLSRKSMIFKSLNITQDEALNGTTALNMLALQKGASILRVHDVRAAVETVKLFQLTKDAKI